MTSKFTHDQIIFVAETILVGALDMIEPGLPTSIDWQDRTGSDLGGQTPT